MGKTRKALFSAMLMFCLWAGTLTSYATSLDDLVNQTQAQTEIQETQVQETQTPETEEQVQEGGGFFNIFGGSDPISVDAEMDEDSAENFGNWITNTTTMTEVSSSTAGFSKAVNMLCTALFQYFVAVGMGAYMVTIAVDIIYILVPFSRKWLANGFMGNPTTQESQQIAQQAAAGTSVQNAGYPGRGYNNQARQYNQQQQVGANVAANNQAANGRLQLVSEEALNVVSQASAGNKDGMMDYLKDCGKKAILATVILVLAASGVFAFIGTTIASLAIGFVSKISNSL